MSNKSLNDFKQEVDSLYLIVSEDISKILDSLHGSYGSKFWTRFNGYGLYRFCYIFLNEYQNQEVLLSNKKYLTFDSIRNEYEFGIKNNNEINYTVKKKINLLCGRIFYYLFRPKYLFWRVNIPRPYLISQSIKSGFKYIKFQLSLNIISMNKTPNENLRVTIFDETFCDRIHNERKRRHLVKFFIKYYPMVGIELFKEIEYDIFQRYNFLQYSDAIVNESFTSDHEASIILSLLNHKFYIKHYYNEHNKLTHVFRYNTLDIISSLVDLYFTIGWTHPDSANIKKSQSLYGPFLIEAGNKRFESVDCILYICGATFVNITEFANSSIESSGRYRRKFIHYRDEILNFVSDCEKINLELKLHPLFTTDFVKKLDLTKNITINKAKKLDVKLLSKYKLIYCEYLSTVYIECIINDIPVICLCDAEAYEADSGCPIVDKLYEVGIFHSQTCSVKEMLQLSAEDICKWWTSPDMEHVKRQFRTEYVSFGEMLFMQLE